MSAERRNELGQPIGAALPDWSPRPRPPRTAMDRPVLPGRAARPRSPRRRSVRRQCRGPRGPQLDLSALRPLPDLRRLPRLARRGGLRRRPAVPRHHRQRRAASAVGVASYMRIDPAAGVIEVGGINLRPRLQRTPAATEAMYLMMRRAFDELGYRRYEWKCDALNAPSRAAAAAARLSLRRACSARRRSTRAAAATPPGSRSSTASGRPCARRSSAGSTRPISTATAASAEASSALRDAGVR